MILGDMGAEVIKVEMPNVGEDARTYGPLINGESGYFLSLHRNKKSLTLDLHSGQGKEILRKLLVSADILLESFRPGVMDRLGFSCEQVKKLNSKLLYASISGFGHTGPYGKKSAFDMVVQGYGGIMSITGPVTGEPTRVGVSIADITCGLYTTIGLLGSLLVRQRTGMGDFLDMAMMDCQVAILENAVIRYFGTGEIPKPLGARHPSITPFGAFKTKDGHVIICTGGQDLWEKVCDAIGCEELRQDPRFKTNADRTNNYDLFKPLFEDVLSVKTTTEWLDVLEKAGIPCGPVNNIGTVFNDKHVNARGMIRSFEHPKAGVIKVSNNPIRSTNNPVPTAFNAPPLLGQNNIEILHSLGFDDEAIEKMRREKVI